MRKITESTFVSLDGVTEDPRAWAMGYFNEDAQKAALEQLQASDGMLMGRGTYEYFAAALPAGSPYADAINAIRKYVFSSTLERADWNNSTIVGGYSADAIGALKDQVDGGIYVSGSGTLVRALLADGLVDELHLFVYPLALGTGAKLFGDEPVKFTLAQTHSYDNGVLHLAYRTA